MRDEFSEENVIFWKKCEQYRKSTDAAYRKQLARLIYVDHVAESSDDQVNIDADVRLTVERRLSTAPVNLFDDAQRQIYLLMKYDPYPRYVKTQRSAGDDVVGLMPPPFEELGRDSDYTADDGEEKERRRWSLLPNWLADRRRRVSVRDEVDVVGQTNVCGRQTGDVTAGRESSSGLTRFIKRLSQGDRKTHAPPPPPASARRRNDAGARKPAQPTTPSAARPQPPPSSGTKRNAVESSRALVARRSTSVLGLNSVNSVSQKSQLVSRTAVQRTIRYR